MALYLYSARSRHHLVVSPLIGRECVCKYMCLLPARKRLARSPCGTCSAFDLISLLAADASSAIASCGDYVHVGDPEAAQPVDSLAFWAFESSALKFSSAPFDPQPSCRGPICREHSPSPGAPPRTVQRFDHWACLPTPTGDCGCYKTALPIAMALSVPEVHPFLHERPPRSSMKG